MGTHARSQRRRIDHGPVRKMSKHIFTIEVECEDDEYDSTVQAIMELDGSIVTEREE